jgi:hypothetical protein
MQKEITAGQLKEALAGDFDKLVQQVVQAIEARLNAYGSVDWDALLRG